MLIFNATAVFSKHYKPIITLHSSQSYPIENIKINECNLLKDKINSISKEVELHLSGIGHITRIKIIVKLDSQEKRDEIYKLINDLKTPNG